MKMKRSTEPWSTDISKHFCQHKNEIMFGVDDVNIKIEACYSQDGINSPSSPFEDVYSYISGIRLLVVKSGF